MLKDEADARLLDRLEMIDASLAETRVSIDGDRDARRAGEAVLNQKIVTAKEAATRSTRAVRAALAAIVVAVLFGLVGFLVVHHQQDVIKRQQKELDAFVQQAEADRINELVKTCLNSNQARVDREARDEALGGLLLDTFAEIATPPTTPEAAATRQHQLDKGKGLFAEKARTTLPQSLQPRDCSVEGVTNPTLVTTPPS